MRPISIPQRGTIATTHAGFAVVQKATGRSGAATTKAISYTTAVKAGSLLIAVVASYDQSVGGGQGVVNGSVNGAFTLAVINAANYNAAAVWYKENCSAGNETVTFSGGGDYISAVILEVTGAATSSSFDKAGAVGPAPGSLSVTASAQNSSAKDLVFCAFTASYSGIVNWRTPTTGYTLADVAQDADADTSYVVGYKFVNALETSAANVTNDNPGNSHCAIIATFKSA